MRHRQMDRQKEKGWLALFVNSFNLSLLLLHLLTLILKTNSTGTVGKFVSFCDSHSFRRRDS